MAFKKILFPSALVLALAACGSVNHDHHHGHHHHHHHGKAQQVRQFECSNGLTVGVQNLGNDQLRLTANGQALLLKNAVAGSGVRYVADNGFEWHEKRGEAAFAYRDAQGNHEVMCTAK
ncbi:MliC family protein [Neisseria sp. ZJ106]|uniref:MliC family protein n=1 Tax=Neisseria lisongii TaxID=2912188 RepID=A0AAW5ASD9_9NEIS|nr:MliC family protein [Neisseria lisongii]MCF7520636.1 MliC family protein [Neisseria lisongii]MCF7529900.1 MliC family protein [Neisseria lisongii]WCL71430.1 MliC family protein [Neisseria lisongii]